MNNNASEFLFISKVERTLVNLAGFSPFIISRNLGVETKIYFGRGGTHKPEIAV